MIDYKKLELAHQLCQKLNGVIYADFIMSAYHCEYTISNSEGPLESNPFFITESLDEFIEKLRKFVDVPVAKYKIGQVVHFLYRNTLHNSEILGYEWSLEKHCYYCEIKSPRLWWYESELYPTKAALIKAQIDHWYGLKSEAILDGYECRSSTNSDDVSMQSPFEGEIKSLGEIIYKASQCVDGCEWDGILLSKNPNLGKCKKCDETCFIALDHSAEMHEKVECEHKDDGGMYFKNVPGESSLTTIAKGNGMCKCIKCGEFYR